MNNPFTKNNPLYKTATNQNFASEKVHFKSLINVFELLFSQMAFGNFFLNVIDFRDFSYPYNSPSCEYVTGYTANEITNLDWLLSVMHPEDLKLFTEYGSNVMAYISKLDFNSKRNIVINHCFRLLHKRTKKYVWLYQQNHMSYIDKNGAIVYSISFVTEVSHILKNQQKTSFSVIERNPLKNIYHIGFGTELPLENDINLLSKREKEILLLSAKGKKSKNIAAILNISNETVITYKKRILKKTKSKNLTEAISFMLNLGYV